MMPCQCPCCQRHEVELADSFESVCHAMDDADLRVTAAAEAAGREARAEERAAIVDWLDRESDKHGNYTESYEEGQFDALCRAWHEIKRGAHLPPEPERGQR